MIIDLTEKLELIEFVNIHKVDLSTNEYYINDKVITLESVKNGMEYCPNSYTYTTGIDIQNHISKKHIDYFIEGAISKPIMINIESVCSENFPYDFELYEKTLKRNNNIDFFLNDKLIETPSYTEIKSRFFLDIENTIKSVLSRYENDNKTFTIIMEYYLLNDFRNTLSSFKYTNNTNTYNYFADTLFESDRVFLYKDYMCPVYISKHIDSKIYIVENDSIDIYYTDLMIEEIAPNENNKNAVSSSMYKLKMDNLDDTKVYSIDINL